MQSHARLLRAEQEYTKQEQGDDESSDCYSSSSSSEDENDNEEQQQQQQQQQPIIHAAKKPCRSVALKRSSSKTVLVGNGATKKKKVKARRPFDVAKDQYEKLHDTQARVTEKYRAEIAQNSQQRYREDVVKKAGDSISKIAIIFRDRTARESYFASQKQLRAVLTGQVDQIVAFDIVLKRGRCVSKTNTLKKIHFTGIVTAPYSITGHRDMLSQSASAAAAAASVSGFHVHQLRFAFQINGKDWQCPSQAAIEEVLYFLLGRATKELRSEQEVRSAFDASLRIERQSNRAMYNYLRCVLIGFLVDYARFLHGEMTQAMNSEDSPIEWQLLLNWLRSQSYMHL